jgi:type IV pilus assembly protein PilC
LVVFGLYYRTNNGRHVIDRLLLRLPVFGPLQQKSAIASFSSTFGLLLKSGVNIVESIEITKGTAGNVIVEDILTRRRTRCSVASRCRSRWRSTRSCSRRW